MPEFREHHKFDCAMSFKDIALALGYKHSASAKWIYDKAIRKLQRRYTKDYIRRIILGEMNE